MTEPKAEYLTIKQAADALGITPIAVRRRLTRGKLQGHKDDRGQWCVILTEADRQDELVKHAVSDSAADSGRTQGLTEVITTLRDEVHFLRGELDQRSEELRRKDIMLAEFARSMADLKSRLPELPTTTSTSPTEVNTSKPSWWRRIFYGSSS